MSVRWVTLWVRPPPCENMCVRSLGKIVGASPPLFVRSLGKIVGASPPLCVRSLGYIGGASSPLRFRSITNTVGAPTPPVCPFIGRQSSLDHCMLPPPLWGILSLPGGIFKMFAMWNL